MLSSVPTLDHLFNLFPVSNDRPEAVELPASELPQPYYRLLVHTDHMTVTVEEFFRARVGVRVLATRRGGNEYSRKILLFAQDTRLVVQFGLVRIDLSVCSEPVRNEILEGKTPLGRVLIQHDMLRRIEPVAYLRVKLRNEMAGWFGVEPETITFGRIGVIYTGNRVAVEVLEILAPIPGEPGLQAQG